MHQANKSTTPPRNEARRVAIAVMLCLAFGALYAARTDPFMRPLLNRELAELGQQANARITFERITPAGAFGVHIYDVEFRPLLWSPERDQPLLRIERLTVHPTLRSILARHPHPASVSLRRPQITALLDSSGGALDQWLEWLSRESRARAAAAANNNSEGQAPSAPNTLPDFEIDGGFVTLDDPSGQYPSAGIRLREVHFDASTGITTGELEVEGLGRASLSTGEDGITLQLHDAASVRGVIGAALPDQQNATLGIADMTFSWPPQLTVHNISLSGLATELSAHLDASLHATTAESITVTFDAWGYRLEAEDATASLRAQTNDMSLVAQRIAVARSWAGGETIAAAQLVDGNGNALALNIEQHEGDQRISATVQGTSSDLAPLLGALPLPVDVDIRSGTITLDADFLWDDALQFAVGHLDAEVASVGAQVPLFARTTLYGINARFAGDYSYMPTEERFTITDGFATIPSLRLRAAGEAELSPDVFRLSLDIKIPPTSPMALLRGLPSGLAPTLRGVDATGSVALNVRLRLDSDFPEDAIADVDVNAVDFHVLTFGALAPVESLLEDDFVLSVTGYEGGVRLYGPGTEDWVSLSDLPAHAFRAVIAAEDDGFFTHSGFDPRGIAYAVERNLFERRFARGGSTITQQLVKNLFLDHDRTIARKLQEAFLTWQVEQTLSKTRILELYLNLVHWGPGVYGINQAAQAYFNHSAGELTIRESAFLAAVLPNPNMFAEDYVHGVVPPSRWVKMNNILANMRRGGYLTDVMEQEQRRLLSLSAISRTPPPAMLGIHTEEPLDLPNAGALLSMGAEAP
ncbi:MAG: monofunctional biosynthetic peptidoglycan transglycosylase [Bradymonadia bacterium]|jgi:monofunctional biosynthetic peptidoglycan transglycosylase